MCGINGFYSQSSSNFNNVINKMNQTLLHRGPDNKGIWIDENFGITLAHTRLSIVDLSINGSQPMLSQTGRFIIVFNGEIYNFLELKKELENKGHIFRTKTDTEVFMTGLIEEGPKFQLKCNGMWAFCLWDNKLKRAILGRDRFGVKPLYYSLLQDNSLIFASEMKALTPFLEFTESASSNITSLNGVARSNITSFNTITLANITSINGVTN